MLQNAKCKKKRSDPVLSQNPQYHQKMKVKRKHIDVTKTFDYKTIADRLRAVSWSSYCYPTSVVTPVYGIPIFPLTEKDV